jgi:hypothetical protein
MKQLQRQLGETGAASCKTRTVHLQQLLLNGSTEPRSDDLVRFVMWWSRFSTRALQFHWMDLNNLEMLVTWSGRARALHQMSCELDKQRCKVNVIYIRDEKPHQTTRRVRLLSVAGESSFVVQAIDIDDEVLVSE